MTPVRTLVRAALVVCLLATSAHSACRQALVLALDVSGSVDQQEYGAQLHGLARALENPEVRQVLLRTPETPVHVTVFEWSGNAYQRMIMDWIAIDSAAALSALTTRLRGWRRAEAPQTTSIGGALLKSIELLERGPDCWKRTIDISGDGQNNDWPQPQDVRRSPALQGVTINALVIAVDVQARMDHEDSDVAELSAYFANQIIQGHGAFIEVALGFDDYAEAMTRKLLRELETFAIGALAPLP